MFCSKCGAKVIEGSLFCEKCGARLIQDSMGEQSTIPVPIQQSVEMPNPSVRAVSESDQKSVKERKSTFDGGTIQVPSPEPVSTSLAPAEPIMETTKEKDTCEESSSKSGSNADIYAILKKNIDMCPVIKSAKQVKKGVHLRGKIYRHSVRFVNAHTDQVRIKSVLAFPFSILYGLLAGLFCFIIWIILAEFMKYGSICIEYYHGILFALCCLVTGAVVLIHSFVGIKEKTTVTNYVREVTEPKSIYLFARKRVAMSKIKIIAAVVLVMAGIILLPFNLPNLANSIKYPDELLNDGLPITRFLEMTQEDVESEFGEPLFTGQHIITGDDYHDYDRSTGSIRNVVYSKETGKVIYIQFYGDYCSCNGKKLNKPLGRVLDILSPKYVGDYYSFGVYGSKHSGFFYDNEAVYFGELPDAEEYIAQQEFEDGRYDNYQFASVNAYGDEYYDPSWSLNVQRRQDYKIDLISSVWMDDVQNIDYVCLYTDEWIETLNDSNENAANNEFGSDEYNDKPETDQYMPSSDVENISLSEIYTNEEEGFSFMYPDDWEIENVEEVNPGALASVAHIDESGIWARIAVMKEIDDGSIFAATKSDLEEIWSESIGAAGFSDAKVMNLSDMELDGCSARKLTFAANNDIGARLIYTQYFYIWDSYVYSVVCVVYEDDYNSYEPIFNAIMDTYTITAPSEMAQSFDASEIINIYEGSWSGLDYDRLHMEISYVDEDGGYFDISAGWANSASEGTQWYFEGFYEDGGIHYYGDRIEYIYYENGEMNSEVVSEAEEGILWIGEDGVLYWDDFVDSSEEYYALEKSIY